VNDSAIEEAEFFFLRKEEAEINVHEQKHRSVLFMTLLQIMERMVISVFSFSLLVVSIRNIRSRQSEREHLQKLVDKEKVAGKCDSVAP
jgi:hypothetical protein